MDFIRKYGLVPTIPLETWKLKCFTSLSTDFLNQNLSPLSSFPLPAEEKYTHTMNLPLPRFTMETGSCAISPQFAFCTRVKKVSPCFLCPLHGLVTNWKFWFRMVPFDKDTLTAKTFIKPRFTACNRCPVSRFSHLSCGFTEAPAQLPWVSAAELRETFKPWERFSA